MEVICIVNGDYNPTNNWGGTTLYPLWKPQDVHGKLVWTWPNGGPLRQQLGCTRAWLLHNQPWKIWGVVYSATPKSISKECESDFFWCKFHNQFTIAKTTQDCTMCTSTDFLPGYLKGCKSTCVTPAISVGEPLEFTNSQRMDRSLPGRPCSCSWIGMP